MTGKTKEDFGHGAARFVTYINVYENPIAELSNTDKVEIDSKQNEVRQGDILFTTSSETPEEVGLTSLWRGNQANVYLNSFCFGYRQYGVFNDLFLAYLLRSDTVRDHIILLAQGISRFNISKTKVMDINVPTPSSVEQVQVGEAFFKIDCLITLHQCHVGQNETNDYNCLDCWGCRHDTMANNPRTK